MKIIDGNKKERGTRVKGMRTRGRAGQKVRNRVGCSERN